MAKAAVLLLLVGCEALKLRGPTGTPKDEKGITYSLKAKDQEISNKKLNKEEIDKVVEKHSTGAMADVGNVDDYLQLWYVNMNGATDREKCMERQIKEMNLKPYRYKGLNFHQCQGSKTKTAAPDIVRCLINNGYGDCVKKGIQSQGVSTHGSKGADDATQKYHIISNACGHKRLMSHILEQKKKTNSTAKYALLLEDDVAFNRHDFARKIVNFAEKYDGKYNETWHMVQIDPFGSKCDKQIVGYFEGLPVWKPANVNNNWECSNYWGAQALLVKINAIPQIVSHMELNPTVPLDWLPAELEHGLAAQLNIAKNPEAQEQYYAGEIHKQWVQMPSYCKKSVKESTIGKGPQE
jgi:hypothetical protein